MKQFLPLIVLCVLVGCQKGSTNENQTANADSVVTAVPSPIDTTTADPSIQALINHLGPAVEGVHNGGSTAKYRMRGPILIVTIRDEEEMSWSFRLGLFDKEGASWRPMFKNETVLGTVDTLIDMNYDGIDELIVNDERGQSAGASTTILLYAKIDGQYDVVDTIGTSTAGFDAYRDKLVTSRTFEDVDGGINIRIKQEIIPGMDPTTQKQKSITVLERIWTWSGRLSKSLPTDFLIINGENIWVRDAPTTGKVVMKLNSGDKCKILQKGKEETIRGKMDNWYKIDFNGKTGWVFGSQTSVSRI